MFPKKVNIANPIELCLDNTFAEIPNVKHDVNFYKKKCLKFALKLCYDDESLDFCKDLAEKGFNFNFLYQDGRSPLMMAAHSHRGFISSINYKIIKLLIKCDVNINLQNSRGETALMYLAKFGFGEWLDKIIGLFLKSGANLNLQDLYGNTALMLAFSNKQNASQRLLLKTFIDNGANIYLTNKAGETALTLAAQDYRTSILELVIRSVSNNSLKSEYGTNALIAACKSYSQVEFIDVFVEAGVDVNSFGRCGKTALMTTDCPNCATELIKFGADINLRDPVNGNTALMLCSSELVANVLINSGSDINLKNNHGCTALMLAETLAKTMLLIKKGAEIDSVNNKGQTALMMAECASKVDVLLSAGANINFQDVNGRTALMLAINRKDVNVCEELIDAGADIMIKDQYGLTALDLAVREISEANFSMSKLLIDNGAKLDDLLPNFKEKMFFNCCKYIKCESDFEYLNILIHSNKFDVNKKNSDGQTGLMVATSSHLVNFLLIHGIDINQVDSTGKTALMIHIKNFEHKSDMSIIQLLINAGCNIDIVDKNNQHALMIACEKSDNPEIKKCIKLLAKLNFDLELIDKFGYTCFKYVLEKSSDKKLIDMIRKLSA